MFAFITMIYQSMFMLCVIFTKTWEHYNKCICWLHVASRCCLSFEFIFFGWGFTDRIAMSMGSKVAGWMLGLHRPNLASVLEFAHPCLTAVAQETKCSNLVGVGEEEACVSSPSAFLISSYRACNRVMRLLPRVYSRNFCK